MFCHSVLLINTLTNEDKHLRHAMVVDRMTQERKVVGVVAVERARRFVGGRRRATSKIDPQREEPWLTSTESCESGEVEENRGEAYTGFCQIPSAKT